MLERGRGGEPVSWLYGEQAGEDLARAPRQMRPSMERRPVVERLQPPVGERAAQFRHPGDHAVLRLLVEHEPAREELGHDAPERPHVDARAVVPAARQLLWRAVEQRAHAALRVRRRPLGRPHRRGRGEPQVADLERAGAGAHEDVAGLDVAVDDPGAVHPFRAAQELPHERAGLALREPRRGPRPLQAQQAAAGDELHDEERGPGGGVHDHVADAHDRRVAAARRHAAGLAEDAAEVVAVVAAAIGRRRRLAGTLDGHRLARAAVPRLDHHAEAARPDRLLRLVVADAPQRDPSLLVLVLTGTAAGRVRAVGRRALARRGRRRREESPVGFLGRGGAGGGNGKEGRGRIHCARDEYHGGVASSNFI